MSTGVYKCLLCQNDVSTNIVFLYFIPESLLNGVPCVPLRAMRAFNKIKRHWRAMKEIRRAIGVP